jgi:hypothetical protein
MYTILLMVGYIYMCMVKYLQVFPFVIDICMQTTKPFFILQLYYEST